VIVVSLRGGLRLLGVLLVLVVRCRRCGVAGAGGRRSRQQSATIRIPLSSRWRMRPRSKGHF